MVNDGEKETSLDFEVDCEPEQGDDVDVLYETEYLDSGHDQIGALPSNLNASDGAAVERQEITLDSVGENYSSFGHGRLYHQFLRRLQRSGHQGGLRVLALEGLAYDTEEF